MNTTVFFPKAVVDLNGYIVNVDELAKRYTLIFITLKATWCPVCPQLLSILNLHGLQDDPPASFRDPFDRSIMVVPQEEIPFNRLLLRKDAFFIIICPGPIEKVRIIQNDCKFSNLPYHFVVDEDLSLATSISLRMSRNEIWPCIAHISPDTLAVRPVFFGRGPGFYGYRDLLNYLRELRVQAENSAANIISKAIEVESRLKKSMALENSVENVQQQIMQTGQPHQEQVFPIELITQIFEYLEPTEIVKTIMATSRLWRAIGFEVIVMDLNREIKSISESLVTYPRTAINQMPHYSRIIKQKNKLVGIYELNQRIKSLVKLLNMVEIKFLNSC